VAIWRGVDAIRVPLLMQGTQTVAFFALPAGCSFSSNCLHGPNSRDKRNDYMAIRTLCGFVYDGQSVQIRQSNMQFATDWHAQWLDRNWPQSPSAVHRLKGTRK